MNRVDLRKFIIPTVLKNINPLTGRDGSRAFDTTDFVYLDSYDDQFNNKIDEILRRTTCTDFALMNYAYKYNTDETALGEAATWTLLRSADQFKSIASILGDGSVSYTTAVCRNATICPSLHYSVPSNKTKNVEQEVFDIKEIKDATGKVIYHTLQIGEYPQTKVNEDMTQLLESLYNNGNIKDNLMCTGRWYTVNGQKQSHGGFAGKHVPEFEYKGERYVRVITLIHDDVDKYSDGTLAGPSGTVEWVKVEPISFVIKNWNQMPKIINPKGNGRAKYFDLRAEKSLLANIPFYPDEYEANNTLWQNSTPRGFLNGINVIDIKQNGNAEYPAHRGGNFLNGGNFLDEAFNLAREPVTEFIIPRSETIIPDDAFNGCLSIKKVTIHSGIKSIGTNAFAGLDFKYAYRTEEGETVLDNELPKEKNIKVLDIKELNKVLDKFDYNILIKCEKFEQLIELLDVLNKNKFGIPYVYAEALIESGAVDDFCIKSDFRFFKNEIPDINELLKQCSDDEKFAFFKFAASLGCFSKERMLDKNGTIFAQKASSLLALILNTKKINIRRF